MPKTHPLIRSCPLCGSEYQYRRASGRTFDRCEACRQADCVICGKKVPLERGRKNTCCEACAKLKISHTQSVFYAKKVAENPNHNKEHHAKEKQRLLDNPELLEAYREKERERSKRRAADPEYRKKRQAYQARRYAENRENIQAARREKWLALSEDEKEKRRIANREVQKASKRKWREKMQQNPEQWEAYQEKMREYRRERKRQAALAELRRNIEHMKGQT